ncbi:MAG: XRE family transcriptional regulator, partial [Bacteroidota bacterium]
SIEAAKKIADAFEVSLDFLVGEGQHASFDKKTLKRLELIESLDDNTKDKMWFFIDTVLRDAQARQAYAS